MLHWHCLIQSSQAAALDSSGCHGLGRGCPCARDIALPFSCTQPLSAVTKEPWLGAFFSWNHKITMMQTVLINTIDDYYGKAKWDLDLCESIFLLP